MIVAPSTVVAWMLLDLLKPVAPVALVEPVSQFSSSGQGELSVVFGQTAPIGSVPQGATRIPLGTLDLSASCDYPIHVDSISLRHVGLGNAQDVTGVYAVQGFSRVTRVASFDPRSSTATLRFRAVTVPACGAVSLTILGDTATDAGVASEHGIDLRSVSDIVSSAQRTTLSLGDATLRQKTTPSSHGSLSVRLLPVTGRLRYGRIETVARLQFTAETSGAHLLERIVLTNTENARDMDLQSFTLETPSGKVLTPITPRMRGYTVALSFKPTHIVRAGETLVLNLKALVQGSITKKVNFVLEEAGDLVARPYRSR